MDQYIEFKVLTEYNQKEVEAFVRGSIKGTAFQPIDRVIDFYDWNGKEVQIKVGDIVAKTQFGIMQVPRDYYLYRSG